MTDATTTLTGWNQFPVKSCTVRRPEKYRELQAQPSLTVRGQGRSYGDAALNDKGVVLLTERLNRVLAFDKEKGTLRAESGITLAEILAIIVPAGWFLPVTPGTQYVSLGGCVAADVHGKNHHHTGSFGQHVLSIELITADNNIITCSSSKNADLFWATIGGMGLTGIIGTITIRLIPVANRKIFTKNLVAYNLEQMFQLLSDPIYDDQYTVAWIDCLATGQAMGRGIVMTAHHAQPEELINQPAGKDTTHKTINLPINCPAWLLNQTTIKLFNNIYFARQAKKTHPFIVDYQQFFYPLDTITHWYRLYGKRGFIQYQCVLPESESFVGIKKLLEKLAEHHVPAFLGVLKRFGPGSPGLLSFPMPGFTLAMDIPLKDTALFKLFDELDTIVLQHHGRLYLAKDARLTPKTFRAMYPNYPAWLVQKQHIDPQNYFTSSLAARLQIGY